MTISEQLIKLNSIKADIKNTINKKGGDVDDNMTTYANAILNISDIDDQALQQAFIESRNISYFYNRGITFVKPYAFYHCSMLTEIDLPNCIEISHDAFNCCSNLTNINIPNCTAIGNSAFKECSNLTNINIPNCTIIRNDAFRGCTRLNTIKLLTSTVCKLTADGIFWYTGIQSDTGSIFVPASLVSEYKQAPYWRSYSNRIFSYEENN